LPVLPSHASIILLLKHLISRERSISRGRDTDGVCYVSLHVIFFPGENISKKMYRKQADKYVYSF